MQTLGILLCASVSMTPQAVAGLSVERIEKAIAIKAAHYTLKVDLTKGGEIAEIRLHDGGQWNTVLSAPELSLPGLKLCEKGKTYSVSSDPQAELVELAASPERVSLWTRAVPRTRDGAASPWQITMGYEICPEGAVFIDLTCTLVDRPFTLSRASVSFGVDASIRKAPKYNDRNITGGTWGFRSARVAFGMNARTDKSYTNEIEAIVEHKGALAGAVDYAQKDGVVTWTLGGGDIELKPGYTYTNRMTLALASAEAGKPNSNVVGQRVYHWVNWLDTKNWYPTNEQIDRMVANHGTMLVLHHEWMLQRGSNGHPHADYRVVRNRQDMVRTIDHAHKKGMRVGLYMRGVEPYALKANFFQKYCKRNWDGIYVDWHGPWATGYHDNRFQPEPQLGDTHFSEKGTHVPARDYFYFTRALRDVVGPGGFLIGHMGGFNSGVLANLCFDAYLPGEHGSDRQMLSSLDEAIFKGMQGGVVCMPWMLDLPKYRNAEGAAKMAAWGFYPHIVLGIESRQTKNLTFSCDPDDREYAFIQPYWRVLAKIDAEKATVYNLPSRNAVAVASTNPDFYSTVYKEDSGTYLLIVANLGRQASKAKLTLARELLGMSGTYDVTRIDAATGRARACGQSEGTVETSDLPQWGIEGFKFTRR